MGEPMGEWDQIIAMVREEREKMDAIRRLIADANSMWVPPRRPKPYLGFRLPSVNDRVQIVGGWNGFAGETGTVTGVRDHMLLVLLDGECYPLPFGRNAVSVVAWGDA